MTPQLLARTPPPPQPKRHPELLASDSDDSDAFEDANEFPDPSHPQQPTATVRDNTLVRDLAAMELIPNPSLGYDPVLAHAQATPQHHRHPLAQPPPSTLPRSHTDQRVPKSASGKHHRTKTAPRLGFKKLLGRQSSSTDSDPLPEATYPRPPATAAELDTDLANVLTVLDLFLNSQLQEAEQQAQQLRHQNLYGSLGYSAIMYLKAVMTFEDQHMEVATEALKGTVEMANQARKSYRKENSRDTTTPTSLVSSLGTGVLDTLGGFMGKNQNHMAMRTMTRHQLHAELVYAEACLLRSILNIYNEDGIIKFLREGLHVRSGYMIYRDCGRLLEWASLPENSQFCRENIDEHFVSGVALGLGVFNLILSMLPGKYLRIIEVFGFAGDREYGLEMLEVASGYRTPGANPKALIPSIYRSPHGLRRVFSDLSLLFYLTVFSSAFPLNRVDIGLAHRILKRQLDTHPQSVLFLYFSARTYQIMGHIPEAIVEYHRTIALQRDWAPIKHLCYWELVIDHIAILQFSPQPVEFLDILIDESKWSKAVYTYTQAACMYQAGASRKVTREAMNRVNHLKQKIGGQSIPIEKFVARKARKFFMQNQWLLLPGLELALVWNIFSVMPREQLWLALEMVDKELARMAVDGPQEDGPCYYDDLCLAYLLRGVVLRELVYPTAKSFNHAETTAQATRMAATAISSSWHLKPAMDNLHQQLVAQTKKKYVCTNLDQACIQSFVAAVHHGHRIERDHYIFYMAHYHLGLYLLAAQRLDEAQVVLEVVIAGSGTSSFMVPTKPTRYNVADRAFLFPPLPACDPSAASPPLCLGEDECSSNSGSNSNPQITPPSPDMAPSTPCDNPTNATSVQRVPSSSDAVLSLLGVTKRRGKYSLQNMVTLRSFNALQKIKAIHDQNVPSA
ncbi:hypothetical protein H4R34_005251 [Dimargaris verticillata]|uniref:Tetratricopeptide repeat protein 39B n=1 Tax=Dimargaris verticillata TaxID=2761393 RepID=A0A9W8EAX2_9FUNG|nr:hypothetical protein H4R34_005251 [Dimargaris verticillata]